MPRPPSRIDQHARIEQAVRVERALGGFERLGEQRRALAVVPGAMVTRSDAPCK
jgi:hypothetical protein